MEGDLRLEWPPQGPGGPNMTTVTPSVFKMRSEAPVGQPRPQVYSTHPVFVTKKPMRMRGDSKWPPADHIQKSAEPEREPSVRPQKQAKDYSKFFAKNILPSNYTSYKVAPGTQHFGVADEEFGTDM